LQIDKVISFQVQKKGDLRGLVLPCRARALQWRLHHQCLNGVALIDLGSAADATCITTVTAVLPLMDIIFEILSWIGR
jgi:hypothetical protein